VSKALKVAFFSHLLTIAALFVLWSVAGLGSIFLLGIVALGGVLLYQHWLVSPGDLQRVNIAFFNVNAVVSFGILAIGCVDLWLCR
jgi:4-hydroxybenzoate polyprenyltransferase